MMKMTPWKAREHWPVLASLEAIQQEMNRLFNQSLSRWAMGDRGFNLLEGTWSPAVDVFDAKDHILVKADLPGLNKDDIEVSVEGDTLTIKGEKKEERESEGKNYVRSERFYGGFHRLISLPSPVDAANVKAVYRSGVLEITLPKKEEAKPKAIPIEVK